MALIQDFEWINVDLLYVDVATIATATISTDAAGIVAWKNQHRN